MENSVKIMIVDDHSMVRSGLRLIIEHEQDMKVVGEAGSGEKAVEIVSKLMPDIILMDISLPGINGVETTKAILEISPDTKIIALTMYPEDTYLEAFIKAGGVGYIPKSAADHDLINVIRTVISGKFALQPEGVQLLARKYQEISNGSSNLSTLSNREREVLILTVKGFTSKEIGNKLFLSSRTVETYRSRIMTKLGLNHRSELFDFALREKII